MAAFRSRLTAAFIVVVAVTTAVFGITSYVLIRQYRLERFEAGAKEDAAVVVFSASRRPTPAEFDDLLREFQRRANFEAVVVTGVPSFSSSPSITQRDVPPSLVPPDSPGEVTIARTDVAGEPFLVAAVTPAPSGSRFFFFFSEASVLESLEYYRNVLLIGGVVAAVVAALFGRIVARRTLRPVGAAAIASRKLAEGLLETRLDTGRNDEFGQLAESFNRMAEALATKMEELAEAAARERRFTADAAHDLRTPVTGMVSAAAVIEDDLDRIAPPDVRPPIELLLGDVRRLHALVLDLLELAGLDVADAASGPDELPVLEAVKAAAQSWADEATVEADIDPGLRVLADRKRFCRVLGNLVANAMVHGGGRARVTARREGDWVYIDVADNGNGISEEHLGRIFDRFFKIDPARSSGGSGLGLAIALEHARAQGGALSVANLDDGGACFTFALPAADAECEEA